MVNEASDANKARTQLIWVGRAEGVSFLVLLFIAMPLKYLAHQPLAVRVVGGLHGVLFLAYLLAMARAGGELQWSIKRWLQALAASVLPFGVFAFERVLQQDAARSSNA